MMTPGTPGRTRWVLEGRPDNRPGRIGEIFGLQRSFAPINSVALIYAINWTPESRAG
ncbi:MULTISPECIES: hypothetical protein [Serratia]|uniref:hypothetical protein n=1 Tax=Serratia TaxID=613 RepID=UPI00301E557D